MRELQGKFVQIAVSPGKRIEILDECFPSSKAIFTEFPPPLERFRKRITLFENAWTFNRKSRKERLRSAPRLFGVCVWKPGAMFYRFRLIQPSVVCVFYSIDSIRQRGAFSCLLPTCFRRCRGSSRLRRCGTVRGCRKETAVRSWRRSFRCLRQLEPSGYGCRCRQPQRGRFRPSP